MRAPDGSFTAPVIVPVFSWPKAHTDTINVMHARLNMLVKLFTIVSLALTS